MSRGDILAKARYIKLKAVKRKIAVHIAKKISMHNGACTRARERVDVDDLRPAKARRGHMQS